MAKFRDIKTLQKFAAAHASIHNHFNLERRLNRRDIFKQKRSAALAKLNAVARELNERPRKTLQYHSPAEKFAECVAAIG